MLRRLLFAVVVFVCVCSTVHAATTYYITIAVTDELTGERLKGATVQFVETGTYSLKKASAIEQFARPGHYYADLSVDHNTRVQETYEVKVSLNGYQEGRSNITLKKGDRTDIALTVALKRHIQGQLVHVTVLSSEDDKPVNEASVWVAYNNGVTNAEGKTSMQVNEPTEGGFHRLAVYRGSYYNLETRIRVKRFDDDAKQQFVTCRITPHGSSSAVPAGCDQGTTAPIDPDAGKRLLTLVVKVRDKIDSGRLDDTRFKLSGATVELTKPSGETLSRASTNSGDAEFGLDPDRDANANMTLKVTRPGYRDVTGILPGTALVPGSKPIPWWVDLERRDIVKETIDDLNGRLAAKRQELADACAALSAANQFALETRVAAVALGSGVAKFEKMVNAASQACATIPGLRGQIQSLVATTQSKEAALKGKLDAANALVCKTQADAAALEALWNQIIPLAWDVNLNAARAEGLNNRLRRIITDADIIAARFDRADAETPVPLAEFSRKWQEMTSNLKTHRDNVVTPAYDKVRSKRAECVKAHDTAIATVNAAVAQAGLKSDPRAEAFKTSVRALKPQPRKPCDEDGIRDGVRELIEYMERNQQVLDQKVQNLRKVPLCNGQKPEDGLIAQANASTAILIYAHNSNLPDKIKTCKAQAQTQPVTPPTPQQPPPKPAKVPIAFGIQPRTVNLMPGQSQEFRAVVVYADGTQDDISNLSGVVWSPGRIFRAEREGSFKVSVTAPLDQLRTDTATVHVGFGQVSVSIGGPSSANIGDQITLSAHVSGGGAVRYQYEWTVAEKSATLASNLLVVNVTRDGSFFFNLKLRDLDQNRIVAEASHPLYVPARPDTPPQTQGTLVAFRITCAPLQVEPGGRVTCGAWGAYAQESTKAVDLTNHNLTTWKPGKTFTVPVNAPIGTRYVVEAQHRGSSDQLWITVVQKRGPVTGPGMANVRVDVLDSQNRAAVPGATVNLGPNSRAGSSAAFTNIPRGQYALKVSAPGYRTYEGAVTLNFQDEVLPVYLVKTQTTTMGTCPRWNLSDTVWDVVMQSESGQRQITLQMKQQDGGSIIVVTDYRRPGDPAYIPPMQFKASVTGSGLTFTEGFARWTGTLSSATEIRGSIVKTKSPYSNVEGTFSFTAKARGRGATCASGVY